MLHLFVCQLLAAGNATVQRQLHFVRCMCYVLCSLCRSRHFGKVCKSVTWGRQAATKSTQPLLASVLDTVRRSSGNIAVFKDAGQKPGLQKMACSPESGPTREQTLAQALLCTDAAIGGLRRRGVSALHECSSVHSAGQKWPTTAFCLQPASLQPSVRPYKV